ncbi:hypothetical protein F2Q68_00045600 [Brassica cretica]|uniref:NB-ARC domain-containing protein n=1 Tax=Brassica cretica TaxID=69181 RepID=A0A8S9LPQ9_BRACR|nr:hypothetical protein F2Q68_00045600 [Brassica cretica]
MAKTKPSTAFHILMKVSIREDEAAMVAKTVQSVSSGLLKMRPTTSRLAHGLPSALVAYALHLSENTTIERWEDELRLLETSPHKNVEEILRNSYDGLDNNDKIAFLHVACLLNGYPFNHVTSLLDAGSTRINHLSKEIVRQECEYRPFRQRFLWDADDIYNVLDNKIQTKLVFLPVTLDQRAITRSVLDSKSVNEPFPLRDVILDKKIKKIVKAALSVPSRVFIVNQLVRYTHFIVHTQTMQAREGDSRLLFF